MNGRCWSGLMVLGCLLWAGAKADAQYNPYFGRPVFNPYSRPTLSPYLNLLRGGLPAANYYMGVLPEVDRRITDLAYGSAILELDRRLAPASETDPLSSTLTETGHPAYFMTYGGYYRFGTMGRTGTGTGSTPPGRSR